MPTDENGGAQGGAAENGSDQLSELSKRLERLEKENKDLKNENAERRLKNKEAADAAARLAEEQGQFKTQAELLKARLAELEGLEPDAKAWQAHQQQETARIEGLKSGLPQHWQESLDAVPTLAGKQAILRAYEAERSTRSTDTETQKDAHRPKNGAGPPGVDATDWLAIQGNRSALAAAKARDPSGWESFKASLRGVTQRRLTTFEARQLAQQKKA